MNGFALNRILALFTEQGVPYLYVSQATVDDGGHTVFCTQRLKRLALYYSRTWRFRDYLRAAYETVIVRLTL